MNNRYRILIQGKNTQYFLSLLISMHILIYQKEENSLGLILVVNEKDFERIKEIKTSYRITVLNRYGLVKLKYLAHKYFIFLLGILLFLGVVFFLSHITFEVEVVHSISEIQDIIY